MDKKIEVSADSDVEIEFNDKGQAVLSFNHEGKLGGVKVIAYTDAAKLVDKITDMIPGEWDDRLLDDLAKKLLSKKTVA